MANSDETALSTRVHAPIYSWATRSGIRSRLPPLVHRLVARLTAPPLDRLRVGCSYSCFADRNWFGLRASVCEKNLLPYDLDTPHFKVRHGVILWPRFNLYAYTDLQDPDTVYVRSREPTTRWIAVLRFDASLVTLTELAVTVP